MSNLAEQAKIQIDLAAIHTAWQSLLIHDCTGRPERQAAFLEDQALIYADRLASAGLALFEAEACGDRLLASAQWCVTCDEHEPGAVRQEAIAKAAVIVGISGDPAAAIQLAAHAALSAVAGKLTGADLEAFRDDLMVALEAAAQVPQGTA